MASPRILLTGASGQLGAYLIREALSASIPFVAWGGPSGGERFGARLRPIDLIDLDSLSTAMRHDRPDVVIHAAARARVNECHVDPDGATRVNADATARLAGLADDLGTRLVLVSTDLVFDGEHAPYLEDAHPVPLSVYGRTKLAAERAVLAVADCAVARVSLLYGPSLSGRPSFFTQQVDALKAGQPVTLFEDEWRTPLDLTSAARALLALACSDVTGVLHVGGPERLSRLEMGRRFARHLGADEALIRSARRADNPTPEPRPRDVSLDSARWRVRFPSLSWRSYDDALTRDLT